MSTVTGPTRRPIRTESYSDADGACLSGRLGNLRFVYYSFPMGVESPLHRVNIAVAVSLVRDDGRIFQGYGEAELRDGLRPKKGRKDGWRIRARDAMASTLSNLSGARIDLLSTATALQSIDTLMAAVAWGGTKESRALPSSCIYAIETALLDCVAQALSIGVMDLLNPQLVGIPGVLTMGSPEDDHSTKRLVQVVNREPVRDRRARPSGRSLRAAAHQGPRHLTMSARSTTLRSGAQNFISLERQATKIARAIGAHVAAASGSILVDPSLSGTEGLSVEASGPGIGAVPDWGSILSSKGVSYFTTGNLQSPYDRPANVYPDGPGIALLGPNGGPAQAMAEAILGRGMSTVRYAKGSVVAVDRDGRQVPFVMSRTQLSGITASSICNDKEVTRRILAQHGVPTPKGREFRRDDRDSAFEFADEIGYPVVIKPGMGFRGIGVFAGIRNREELAEAFENLEASRLGHQDFILEKHVNGEEFRILVVGSRAVGAIRRIPASVVGDGEHTLGELVLRKNQLRRSNPSLRFRPIKYDADMHTEMGHEDLSLDDIVTAGRTVSLSSTSNLSQGGDSADVLDEIHPSILEASVRAAAAIPGLGFAGVDFLVEDHTAPLGEQESAIIEMNAHASISGVVFPMYGEPKFVPDDIVDLLAARLGLNVNESPSDDLCVAVEVRGRLPKGAYENWIKEVVAVNEISGWMQRVGPRRVEIVARGSVAAVAVLSIAAVMGPDGVAPTSATTRPIAELQIQGFHTVTKPLQEVRLV